MLKPTIKEGNFTPEEISQAHILLNHRLGHDFYTLERVQSFQATNSSKLLLMSFVEDKLCGVLTGEAVLRDDENVIAQLISAKYPEGGDVGLLHSLVVDEDFENKGIGRTLIKKGVSTFRHRGVKQIGSLIWSKYDRWMAQILLSLGFRKMAFLPNYWSKMSEERNFNCPECGVPPCTCTALVYTYNL